MENKKKNLGLAARTHMRAEMEGRVFLHDQQRLFIAPLHNLSAGGLFINKLTAIPVGAEVKLIIKSPYFQFPIQLEGKVVRIESQLEEKKGLAIQFINHNHQHAQIINETVLDVRKKMAQKALKNAA